MHVLRPVWWLVLLVAGFTSLRAQFRDDFDHPIVRDETGRANWNYFTGDGTATMTFTARDGLATVAVDATTDRRGIWWALIKRDISGRLDLARLASRGTELRVEARIRSSHAPKRVNLSFNTERTTDFHTGLMEFDLAEPEVWQTISFTTDDFDARPGDTVNVQLALMDWGLAKYRVDIDYLKVDVVDPAQSGPDLGVPVPYRPPVADPAHFSEVLAPVENATIDRHEPDENLADWAAMEPSGPTHVLTVNGTQNVILRWDLSRYAGRKVPGSGLLELTTFDLQRAAGRRKDFGIVRVVEILAGDPVWTEDAVSFATLCHGRPPEEVFNTQMIIDVDLADSRGESTLITLSRPVLQRMLDGRTKGIAIIALGSLNAAFYPRSDAEHAPKLRFNVEPSSGGRVPQ